MAIVVAILLVIVALLAILVLRDDDSEEVQTALPTTSETATATTVESSTTSSGESTTSDTGDTTSSSTSTTASTTASTTPTTGPPAQPLPAVWPWLDSSTRYDDPVDAARGFAEDFLGFDGPVVGSFRQGDSRSGEVDVQPEADGPVTLVLVRQVGDDDTWWIVGAVTDNIELTDPEVLDEITSPLVVAGRALAFEGVVELELRADGTATPLATGVVTGGGTDMAPFDGSFAFTGPDEPGGAVVLLTRSAENGQVWEASVLRITFPLPG